MPLSYIDKMIARLNLKNKWNGYQAQELQQSIIFPILAEVLPKWEGKKITKRLCTAIQNELGKIRPGGYCVICGEYLKLSARVAYTETTRHNGVAQECSRTTDALSIYIPDVVFTMSRFWENNRWINKDVFPAAPCEYSAHKRDEAIEAILANADIIQDALTAYRENIAALPFLDAYNAIQFSDVSVKR